MDTPHHDTAENAGGPWVIFSKILGAGLCAFAILSGVAFIIGGIKHGRSTPAPAALAAAAAPAAPAASAAPSADSPPVVVPASGEITIKPDPANPLMYDTRSIVAKAGQKIKLTFNNQSILPQPHSFILCKIGKKDAIVAAATQMLTDPNAYAKGYIPESPDIIAHTKLIQAGQSETIEFDAPSEKGDYPYVCTFPGHAIIMNGVMKVE